MDSRVVATVRAVPHRPHDDALPLGATRGLPAPVPKQPAEGVSTSEARAREWARPTRRQTSRSDSSMPVAVRGGRLFHRVNVRYFRKPAKRSQRSLASDAPAFRPVSHRGGPAGQHAAAAVHPGFRAGRLAPPRAGPPGVQPGRAPWGAAKGYPVSPRFPSLRDPRAPKTRANAPAAGNAPGPREVGCARERR